MSDPRLPPLNAWSRLRKNKRVRIAIWILSFVILIAVVGPWILPSHYGAVSPAQYEAPSWSHPFGTDLNGRDNLARVLQGARISLLVGLAGAVISLLVGTSYGMIAGYVGGKTDELMMRFVDILYAVPRLIFILIFINAFDGRFKEALQGTVAEGWIGYSRIIILIVTLGLIEWLTMARIVRGQVLSLKSMLFVTAAKSLGQSHFQILIKHLLPNLIGVVIIYLTLTIPAVILDESFLSFLGLGVEAPQASWGSLLAEGAQVINPVRSYWWLLAFPAVIMSLTLLALNFLGDGLRDALDPRERR